MIRPNAILSQSKAIVSLPPVHAEIQAPPHRPVKRLIQRQIRSVEPCWSFLWSNAPRSGRFTPFSRFPSELINHALSHWRGRLFDVFYRIPIFSSIILTGKKVFPVGVRINPVGIVVFLMGVAPKLTIPSRLSWKSRRFPWATDHFQRELKPFLWGLHQIPRELP
jgi:hypothetical protein